VADERYRPKWTRPGRMRHRITIQKPTASAADSFGETTTTWSDLGTVWAFVLPLQSMERWQAARVNAEITYEVAIRYWAAVDETHRILWGSRTLELAAPPIDVDGLHREMRLMCREAA